MVCVSWGCRGGSMISGKGVHMYKGWGVCFAHFTSFFLNIPWKWNNLVSLRPNYFIFIGYLKMGAGRGVRVNPLWISHWGWPWHISSLVSSLVNSFSLCPLGIFSYFFEKLFQEYHLSVKQIRSRSGPFCLQKLSADDLRRQRDEESPFYRGRPRIYW